MELPDDEKPVRYLVSSRGLNQIAPYDKKWIFDVTTAHMLPDFRLEFPESVHRYLPTVAGDAHLEMTKNGNCYMLWEFDYIVEGSKRLLGNRIWDYFLSETNIEVGDKVMFLFGDKCDDFKLMKRDKPKGFVFIAAHIVKIGEAIPNIWAEPREGHDWGYK